FYEMLTGELPFTGDTSATVFTALLTTEPAAVAKLLPDAPPEVDAILVRALAKDRTRRYQSIGEMVRDLETLRSVWIDRTVSSPKTAVSVPPSKVSPGKQSWRARLVGGIAVAAMVGIGLYAGFARNHTGRDAAPITVPFTSFGGSKEYSSFSP